MLEKSLATYLKEGWQFDRFDGTLRALLLCAAWELVHTTDIDAAVLVKEYVDLAYAFFSKNEPKMVNALLDTIAKKVRLAGI
jgi:N utilization substance protein B